MPIHRLPTLSGIGVFLLGRFPPPTEKLNYLTRYKKILDIFANIKHNEVIQN